MEEAEGSEKIAHEFDISCKSSFLGEFAIKGIPDGE